MFDEILADAKRRMDGAVASFKHNLTGLRTGRASASLIEPIKVEVYGSLVPISQVSTVNVPEARLITVQAWDKSLIKSIEKAIATSGLGLNPVSDGQFIRVPIPDLSEERRKEMSKKVHEYAEHARVSVRNIRRDVIDHVKKMEKEKAISKDQLKDCSDDVQDITDEKIAKIEEFAAQKVREIMNF